MQKSHLFTRSIALYNIEHERMASSQYMIAIYVCPCTVECGKIIIHNRRYGGHSYIIACASDCRYAVASYAEFEAGMCRGGQPCDGTSGAPWGCCRMDIKGARLSWSPSAAKSWGRSHLREPRHSRLSRGHESHCRGDTLYSSIVLIALLFVFWVHRHPISDAINTRTAQCERLRDINTANCS